MYCGVHEIFSKEKKLVCLTANKLFNKNNVELKNARTHTQEANFLIADEMSFLAFIHCSYSFSVYVRYPIPAMDAIINTHNKLLSFLLRLVPFCSVPFRFVHIARQPI